MDRAASRFSGVRFSCELSNWIESLLIPVATHKAEIGEMAEVDALFAWAYAHQLGEWMLVLLTAALAFVTWRLVVETRRMAEDAAKASTEALKVAKDANLITMAGITASNRAWLAIENIVFGQENGRLALDLTLKNYGSVPAVKVSGRFLAMIVGADVESLKHPSAGEPADLFPGVPRITPIILPPIEEVWGGHLGRKTHIAGRYFFKL